MAKEDFSQQSAIFLQPKAQFDTLVALTDSDDRARAIIEATESIESDYQNLRGVLPKSEYQELDNAVLDQLLRTLNPDLPFGLPGVNRKGMVSRGNCIWISYFHSYPNEQSRAGLVMSSQASSAGRDEAKARRKLMETGAVDVMIAAKSTRKWKTSTPRPCNHLRVAAKRLAGG